ncbi:Integrin beta-PS [Chionoecetes opilio]|uniref:Integrin beta-PS n=1 Tax=Chionoecetes opilio TaxID=41210 RepID=A0A8J4Y7V0_CHIOP|nr:Integrin beta-PS [Chionoecetes opilio]
MQPWVPRVWVWVVVMGVAWGASPCSDRAACPPCLHAPDCVWCARNLTGEGGVSLPRCIQLTDDAIAPWREACGESDVHEPVNPSEDHKSEECSFHGAYQCGECVCDAGYQGRQCECEARDLWGQGEGGEDSCRKSNASAVCSGRGSCHCGFCMCHERSNPNEIISGAFCECTNFVCARDNGQMCSGPERGECECDRCRCRPGWTGDTCNCEASTDNCINPVYGEECSGSGECECNQCRCHEGYSGRYCEDCPTCRGKCAVYRACVQCQAFQTGAFTAAQCDANCTLFQAITVHTQPLDLGEGTRICSFFDEDDCRFSFTYEYNDDQEPVVLVQSARECPPPPRNIPGEDKEVACPPLDQAVTEDAEAVYL